MNKSKSANVPILMVVFLSLVIFAHGFWSFLLVGEDFSYAVDSQLLIMVFLNIYLSSFMIVNAVKTKEIKFISLNYWLFQYIFMGVAALSWIKDLNPYYVIRAANSRDFITPAIILLIANLCVALASLFSRQKNRKSHFSLTSTEYRDELYRLTTRLGLLYLAMLPLLVSFSGGYDRFFARSRASYSLDFGPIYSITSTLLYVTPLLIFLILVKLYDFIRIPKVKFQLVSLAFLILFLSNPVSNPRQVSIFLLLPLLTLFLRYKPRFVFLFIPTYIFVTLFASNLVDRYSGELNGVGFRPPSKGGDFDAFAQMVNGVELYARAEFVPLKQLLGSLLFFIPREIWPGKPLDTGVEIARLSGLRFSNLSAPFALEMYINGGVILLVLSHFGLSLLIDRLDRNSYLDVKTFCIVPLATGSAFIVLRGSLLQATGRIVFTVFFVWLFFNYVDMSCKRRGLQPHQQISPV